MKHFPEPLTLEIEAISPFGKGVAKLPLPSGAKALLEVPYTMPGDKASIAIFGKKNSIYRGTLLEIIEPSEKRVTPLCDHFGACGGCSWQHIGYEEQLQYKQELIERFFKKKEKINQIIPCSSPFHYRNKMEFTVKEGVLGLIGESGELVAIKKCHLINPWVSSLLPLFNLSFGLRPEEIQRNLAQDEEIFFEGNRKSAIFEKKRSSDTDKVPEDQGDEPKTQVFNVKGIDRVIFRETRNQKIVIILGQLPNKLLEELKKHPLTIYENEICRFGPKELEETLSIRGKELRFTMNPFSFFQPNTKQAEILFDLAIEFGDFKGDEVVYDLYCGVGTIGICLAPFVKEVIGIEIFEGSVKSAVKNGKLNGLKNYKAVVGDLKKGVKGFKKPDVVVIDPPRGGLDQAALDFILLEKPKKILYISCCPRTLVRDLEVLTKNEYVIEKVQPVDQFPQTVHIETIVLITSYKNEKGV